MKVEEITETTNKASWFKSSYSGGAGGECVEVALGSDAVRVRDSKDVAIPVLAVPRDAWTAFVGALRGGA